MAGTLTVQNIEGPSSGANANKIIIPSGQTLDASGGTLVPSAGAVVQCVQYYDPATLHESTSSSAFVGSNIRKTITPKFSDSLIIAQCVVSMADAWNSSYLESAIYINGSQMTGAGQYHLGYQNQSNSRYNNLVAQVQHPCTSTSSLEFRVYYKGDGNGVRITHSNTSTSLTLWEIKQ